MRTAPEAPTRLARRLGAGDAVIIGLGSMIGAGVFAAFGPAARAAGNGLLVGLGLAALVAYCNATSSAQLAALYPESGGAYVYGRKRLGPFWGFVAGWGFVIGKLASCAAVAMTFGSYAVPSFARPLAVSSVVVLTAVNYFGVQKTAIVTRAIVAIVLVALGTVVAAVWMGGATDVGRLWPLHDAEPYGVLQSAGFLFFAFAGYARLATLGEEVIDPKRVIPRAIPIALAITLVVYATVAVSVLAGAGPDAIATSAAPLATAVDRGRLAFLSPAVRIGATVASLGVLLSLIVGVSRTLFAMSGNRDMPAFLSAVHPRYRVPHRAELLVGGVVAVIAAVADVRTAIGFSSFAVLVYYSIANAAAWTLQPEERRWPRPIAALGLVGCLALAVALPAVSVVGGAALLVSGAIVYLILDRGHARRVPVVAMLGQVRTLDEAEKASDQLELLLRNLGLGLTRGGELERLHLVLKRLADLHAGRSAQTPGEDLRKDFRDLVGITRIIDLALKLPAASLPQFKKHFELLNVATPPQSTPAPRNDPSGEKVLELLVGLAAARMGARVELDDPENARGDNPDVLATYANEVWGFACKVPSGDAPATLFERIEDGVDQIERSAATRGLVVLNFESRFDHASEMPALGTDGEGDLQLGVHRDHARIVDDLKAFDEERTHAMVEHATQPEIDKLFAGKKALPAIMVISQTTGGVRLPAVIAPPGAAGAPAPTRVGFVHLIYLTSSAADDRRLKDAEPMLAALDHALADL